MASDFGDPLNLGSDRLVTINQLADIVCGVAGVTLGKRHIPGPQGVRGRNSDNIRLRRVLGWEPQVTLEKGVAETYQWIEDQVRQHLEMRRCCELTRHEALTPQDFVAQTSSASDFVQLSLPNPSSGGASTATAPGGGARTSRARRCSAA